jgi:antitoxin (DNA-binding transcriptional repressor) of toxin-antitoxin stability system
MKNQVVSVTEFKAKCLAFFDRIDQEGGRLTVTRRGRPVATVEPVKKKVLKSSEGALSGRGKIVGDIVNMDDHELWQWDVEKASPRRKK